MLRFAVGTAVIVLPPWKGAAVLAAIAAVDGLKALKRRLKRRSVRRSNAPPVAVSEAAEKPEVSPVTLEWTNVSCELASKKAGKGTTTAPRVILSQISGVAKPGRLMVLMGPSGSGKTTLLNALAGQLPSDGRITLSGNVTVNSINAADTNYKQAYVQQEDLFYSMLTVSETLEMTSQLTLPEGTSQEQRDAKVAALVSVLGLAKSTGTVVGDAKTRGLSGGEKKRLSIGCELMSRPSLVFLDEPTTGLDAFQAEKVMSTLKDLASAGHTIICSIHQPRSSIFAMFDDLVLLAEGKLVYNGPAQQVMKHFAKAGFKCPEHFNPAEFVADLISVDYSSPESEAESSARIKSMVELWSKTAAGAAQGIRPVSSNVVVDPMAEPPRSSWIRQFRLLFWRSWRQVTRDRPTFIARVMANVSSALVYGAIFFRMARKQSSIQDRLGLLQVSAVGTAMTAVMRTLIAFPLEREIVTRERAKNAYEVLPYLTAKLAAELPIASFFPLIFAAIVYPLTRLNPKPTRFAKFSGIVTLESFSSSALGLAIGAFAPSPASAMAMGPAVMLVWIVFGGYYVNPDNVPWVLRWLPRASLIKQGFEALTINEFRGLKFELDAAGHGSATGEEVVKRLSFRHNSMAGPLAAQARILAFWYWLTYCILKAKKPQFQRMLPVSA